MKIFDYFPFGRKLKQNLYFYFNPVNNGEKNESERQFCFSDNVAVFATMRSRRFFPSRERSSVLLLAITINSQPQKKRQNSGEKTRQTFHENGQRFAKVVRDWGTGRSVPSPPAPAGVFLSFGVRTSCLPQNKN